MNDVRMIGINHSNKLLSMIDASYTIHPNMRGHTGGLMSFGLGILHGKSSKHVKCKSSLCKLRILFIKMSAIY